MKRSPIIAVIVCVCCITLIQNLRAEETTRTTSDTDNDSTSSLLFEDLVQDSDLASPELYELLDEPESVDTRFITTQKSYHLRSRIASPDDNDFPSHLVRFDMRSQSWSSGFLANRDEGEHDAADLKRIWLEHNRGTMHVVAGDFNVDHGLGWTVSSSPTWSSGYEPSSALRRPFNGLRPNRSSEEGRGWFGAGVEAGELATIGNIKGDASFWAGYANYDAREQPDGSMLPYSEQGLHTPARMDYANELRENMFGTTVGLSAHGDWPRIAFIYTYSDFSHTISSEDAPSRFRINGSEFSTGGLLFEKGQVRDFWSFRLETTRQSNNSWGGGLNGHIRPLKDNRIVFAGWRATSSFTPLHSRPYLAFGSDPAGRSGGRLGFETRSLIPGRLTCTVAMEEREARSVDDPREENRELRILATPEWNGPIRTRLWFKQRYSRIGFSRWEWNRSLRGDLFSGSPQRRVGLRGEITQSRDGDGWLVGTEIHHSPTQLLGFSASLTYLDTSGDGVSLVVIDPYAPGLFPAHSRTGELLRLASHVDIALPGGIKLWWWGAAEHSLEAVAEERSSLTWLLGLEWRQSS